MSRLLVQPIVEGHGEEQSVRILLERLVMGELRAESIAVLRPIRRPRSKLLQADSREIERAVSLAAQKIAHAQVESNVRAVLLLIDADEDCPRDLAPQLVERARRERPDLPVLCILANVEYETWFVAAAESLTDYLDLSLHAPPVNPEEQRCGKAWVQRAFRGGLRYSETVDQPRLTATMDLQLCRSRSPSFDKLWRDFERCVGAEANRPPHDEA